MTDNSSSSPPKLSDWLRHVNSDRRLLEWLESAESEDRLVRCFREIFAGYSVDPSSILKPTRLLTEPYPGTVTIRRISFYSVCAHHFLPFFGQIDIAYEPGSMIIGLGKFPRLVKAFARRFQIQEDLVADIAHEVMSSGGALGVNVTSLATHLCMCARGPSDPTVTTDVTYSLGSLADSKKSRFQERR